MFESNSQMISLTASPYSCDYCNALMCLGTGSENNLSFGGESV